MSTKALVVAPRGEVCCFRLGGSIWCHKAPGGGCGRHQAFRVQLLLPFLKLLCPELPCSGNCPLVLWRKVALPCCRAFMYWLLGLWACPWVLLPFCGGGRNLPAVAFPPRVKRPHTLMCVSTFPPVHALNLQSGGGLWG